jgi:hypothetical protein
LINRMVRAISSASSNGNAHETHHAISRID